MVASIQSRTTPRAPITAKAVRRYRAPAYPRAGEPIRLDLADARTWPFRASVAAAVIAAAGAPACDSLEGGTHVGAGTSAGGTDAHTTLGADTASAPDVATETAHVAETATETETESTPTNPFTLTASHLPPSNIWGKGTPGVLPESVAVRAVLGVFAERGVPMVVDAVYGMDGVTVRLDGWNAERGIGFEFIASQAAANAEGAGDAPEPEDYAPPDWAQGPDGSYGPVAPADHPERLDDAELARLDQDLASAKRHIVVINALDPRLAYPSTDGLPAEYWRDAGVDNADQAASQARLVANVHAFLDYLTWQGVL